MNAQLYIPKKIKVGFQKRDGTYTGKLGYVIYWDDKGKLRKEKSWEGWRQKDIDPVEFDNVPMDGFTLNKNIQRGGYDWFGEAVTRIRVYDSRDFEFEITPANLIGVLMHSDCLRRGLEQKCVYAWQGTELVLLTINSEEYQKAQQYTQRQGEKVKVKELIEGAVYETKKEGKLIYLGRFMWHEWEYQYKDKTTRKRNYASSRNRVGKKKFIFASEDGKSISTYPGTTHLARQVGDLVPNYAELIELFNNQFESSKIERFEFDQCGFSDELKKEEQYYYGPRLVKSVYWVKDGENYKKYSVCANQERDRVLVNDKWEYVHKQNQFSITDSDTFVDPRTHEEHYPEKSKQNNYYPYYRSSTVWETKETLAARNLGELYIVLENGKKLKYKGRYEY